MPYLLLAACIVVNDIFSHALVVLLCSGHTLLLGCHAVPQLGHLTVHNNAEVTIKGQINIIGNDNDNKSSRNINNNIPGNHQHANNISIDNDYNTIIDNDYNTINNMPTT